MEAKDNSDDRLIGAWLDGELEGDEADRFAARLANEPGLAQRLEAMRAGDEAVRRVFRALDTTPMPKAVLAQLDKPRRSSDNVVPFEARGMRRFLQVPVALAAGIALAVGLIVGRGLTPASESIPGAGQMYADAIDAGSPLYRLLDSGVSGEAVTVGTDATGEPVLSFEDKRGDYCRQWRIATPEESIQGVACRRDSRWRMATVAYGAPGAPGGDYGQAGSAVPASVAAAVDGLMGAAGPLDTDQEKQLISMGWKKPANPVE